MQHFDCARNAAAGGVGGFLCAVGHLRSQTTCASLQTEDHCLTCCRAHVRKSGPVVVVAAAAAAVAGAVADSEGIVIVVAVVVVVVGVVVDSMGALSAQCC